MYTYTHTHTHEQISSWSDHHSSAAAFEIQMTLYNKGLISLPPPTPNRLAISQHSPTHTPSTPPPPATTRPHKAKRNICLCLENVSSKGYIHRLIYLEFSVLRVSLCPDLHVESLSLCHRRGPSRWCSKVVISTEKLWPPGLNNHTVICNFFDSLIMALQPTHMTYDGSLIWTAYGNG